MTDRPQRARASLLVGLALVAGLLAGCGEARPPFVADQCTRGDLGGRSVARVWDDQTLDLIRQVVPAPTVHARNLFHVSVAMWDAWSAYDPTADGYLVNGEAPGGQRQRRAGSGDELRRLSDPAVALRDGVRPRRGR